MHPFWFLAAFAWAVAGVLDRSFRRPVTPTPLRIPQRPWVRRLVHGALLFLALSAAAALIQLPLESALPVLVFLAGLGSCFWLGYRHGDAVAGAEGIAVGPRRIRWDQVADVREKRWGIQIVPTPRASTGSVVLLRALFCLGPEDGERLRHLWQASRQNAV